MLWLLEHSAPATEPSKERKSAKGNISPARRAKINLKPKENIYFHYFPDPSACYVPENIITHSASYGDVRGARVVLSTPLGSEEREGS